MNSILNLTRREIYSYFVSPIAYTVIIMFLLIVGLGFFFSVFLYSSLNDTAIAEGNQNIRTYVIQFMSFWVNLALMLALPALSMRVLSEERKNGTAELLMTSPITTTQLVLGKFLGTLAILALMLLLTLPLIITIDFWADPEWPALGAAYLGYFLFGAVILAIGLFASSLTENQIVALLMTYPMLLPLWLSELLLGRFSGWANQVVGALSLRNASLTMSLGVIESHAIVLACGLMFLFLFLCVQVIDSARWR